MRRSPLEIKTDILNLTIHPRIKTRIVYLCNLNFILVEKYLSRLISKGLITKSDRYYKTTDKGLTALESAQISLSLF